MNRNAAAALLTGSTSKPSFLFWEKVYQKLNTLEEETWLLRALLASLTVLKNEMKNAHIRYGHHNFLYYISHLTSPDFKLA